jgi:hypothetical protein
VRATFFIDPEGKLRAMMYAALRFGGAVGIRKPSST